jgi:phenylacetic acid degradation operon negative regulatory protein
MRRSRPVAALLPSLVATAPPRASSLVVSVFGDAVVAHGGVVWLGSLIRWLAPFGVNERAVRTAVHRLTVDQWFTSSSNGRRSDYALTQTSRHRFADAERRIYAATPPGWDGSWSVVVLGHGRSARWAADRRDAARRELRWHGFGELAPTVLVHPSADLDELRLALRDLGIERRAIVLRARAEDRVTGGGTPLRELVSSAWDLTELADRYRAYLRRFGPLARALEVDGPPAAEICFRLRVLAIHEYRRILLRDPELPAALLPERWAGAEAATLCATLYRAVAAPAARYIQSSGETAKGPLPPPAPFYFRRFGGLRRRVLRRVASAVALCVLLSLTIACRRGFCPPDTELRGSAKAGQQSCEYQDSNGLSVKHGPFIEWHENGRKRAEGSYDHGKQDGRWRYWDADGRLTAERVYRDGAQIEERTK